MFFIDFIFFASVESHSIDSKQNKLDSYITDFFVYNMRFPIFARNLGNANFSKLENFAMGVKVSLKKEEHSYEKVIDSVRYKLSEKVVTAKSKAGTKTVVKERRRQIGGGKSLSETRVMRDGALVSSQDNARSAEERERFERQWSGAMGGNDEEDWHCGGGGGEDAADVKFGLTYKEPKRKRRYVSKHLQDLSF